MDELHCVSGKIGKLLSQRNRRSTGAGKGIEMDLNTRSAGAKAK